MRYLILLLIILCIITGCNSKTESKRLQANGCLRWDDPDWTDPFDLLVKSQCFRLGPVGYTGEIAPEEIALRRIMKRDAAPFALEKLYAKGYTAGKLYALVGLHVVNKPKFRELAFELKKTPSLVDSQAGCIMGIQLEVGSVIDDIEAGNYDAELMRDIK